MSAPDITSSVKRLSQSQSTFQMPELVKAEPLVEPDLDVNVPDAVEVGDLPTLTFSEIDCATSRSKPRLISSLNHIYTYKKTLKRTGATVWQCSVRNRNVYCTAVVTELNGIYTPGSAAHKCTPKTSALAGAKVMAQLLKESESETFTSAASIVNKALNDHIELAVPTESLPKIETLTRLVNKRRQAIRGKISLYPCRVHLCQKLTTQQTLPLQKSATANFKSVGQLLFDRTEC